MSSIFDGMAEIFRDTLGDSTLVPYTRKGGASVSIKGIFENPAQFSDGPMGKPGGVVRVPELHVVEADLPGGYGQNDTCVVGGKTYKVRAAFPDGRGMVKLELEAIK